MTGSIDRQSNDAETGVIVSNMGNEAKEQATTQGGGG